MSISKYAIKTLKRIHLRLLEENGFPKTNFSINRMAKGNAKLSNDILIFDLPAGSQFSCRYDCKKCYAKRSQYLYKRTLIFRLLNFELAKKHLPLLKKLIVEQLKNSKQKYVRIHSSGDFFNQYYVNMWNSIIKMFPNKKFYAYTKVKDFYNFRDICKNENFNLIESFVEIDGKKFLNYGNVEYVTKLMNEHGYFICPATIKNNSEEVKCGKQCSYCMYNKNVCFVEH